MNRDTAPDLYRPPQAPLRTERVRIPAYVRVVGAGMAVMGLLAAPPLLPLDRPAPTAWLASAAYLLCGVGLLLAPARFLRLSVYVLGLSTTIGAPLALLVAAPDVIGLVIAVLALQATGVVLLSVARWRIAHHDSGERLEQVLETWKERTQRPPSADGGGGGPDTTPR